MSGGAGRRMACICDACGKGFNAYPSKAEREGISCLYIMCPGCGAGYPVAAMDGVSEDIAHKVLETWAERTEESALLRRELMKAMKERSGAIIREHPLEWFLGDADGEDRK